MSIFIGGGTPSLFSPDMLSRLLDFTHAHFSVDPKAEITLEANPGTLDVAKLSAYRQAGVNRLSLGVQSFNDSILKRIGRIHCGVQAKKAMHDILQAGFNNVNIDLMFGLPAQTLADALEDLRIASDFCPPHLSWYQLTLEPGSSFHYDPPVLPDDESLWAMQQTGRLYLLEQDYEHYEISAYAKSGWRCRHNLNYWRFGDYIGVGAGAHGKLSDSSAGAVFRYHKPARPKRYLYVFKQQQISFKTAHNALTSHDLCVEFMMNALRLSEGFSTSLFTARTGLDPKLIEVPLTLARRQGWLENSAEYIRPTEEGLRWLNDMLELFMPDL